MIEKKGIELKIGEKVKGVEKVGKGEKIKFEKVKGGDEEKIEEDEVMIEKGSSN